MVVGGGGFHGGFHNRFHGGSIMASAAGSTMAPASASSASGQVGAAGVGRTTDMVGPILMPGGILITLMAMRPSRCSTAAEQRVRRLGRAETARIRFHGSGRLADRLIQARSCAICAPMTPARLREKFAAIRIEEVQRTEEAVSLARSLPTRAALLSD